MVAGASRITTCPWPGSWLVNATPGVKLAFGSHNLRSIAAIETMHTM